MNLTKPASVRELQQSDLDANQAQDLSSLRREPLLQLLGWLAERQYTFVTATPATHTRVLARWPGRAAANVRDVLGWSLPFGEATLPPEVFRLLREAGAVSRELTGLFKARVRVSRVHGMLFLHSCYPTLSKDSVFLGPDSYRFADLISRSLNSLPEGARILDYGAGAGVGGIVAAASLSGSHLTLADINPAALKLASVNAQFAGVPFRTVNAGDPTEVEGTFDLLVIHPPFMMDEESRAYRNGGDLYGAQLSLDWVRAGMEKLNPGGRLVLHTGVSIVDGRDVLLERLEQAIPGARFRWEYRELDPDIFSEDLDTPPYKDVERIAAIGLSLERISSA